MPSMSAFDLKASSSMADSVHDGIAASGLWKMYHAYAGTIQFRNEERVEFSHIIRSKYVGA